MKRNLLILVLVIATILQSCGGLRRIDKKPRPVIAPDTLSLFCNSSSFDVDMAIAVPPHYVTKQSCVVITPIMTGANNALELTPVILKGSVYAKKERRAEWLYGTKPMTSRYEIPYKVAKKGVVVNYHERVPMMEWMKNSNTFIQEQSFACDKYINMMQKKIASGVRVPAPVIEIIKPVVKAPVIISESGTIYLFYPINSYEVVPSLDKNAGELATMEKLLNKITTDKNKNVTSIDVNATASPDGNYESNKTLAENRASAIKRYIAANIKGQIHSDMITVNSSVAPWSDILPYVMDSKLSAESKAKIQKAVDNAANMTACEKALKAMKPEWHYLKTEVLPKLRRAKYSVNYTQVLL